MPVTPLPDTPSGSFDNPKYLQTLSDVPLEAKPLPVEKQEASSKRIYNTMKNSNNYNIVKLTKSLYHSVLMTFISIISFFDTPIKYVLSIPHCTYENVSEFRYI